MAEQLCGTTSKDHGEMEKMPWGIRCFRRNRTIYKRMREYLYELTHSDELVTAVMPIGDGITVSTKI